MFRGETECNATLTRSTIYTRRDQMNMCPSRGKTVDSLSPARSSWKEHKSDIASIIN